MNLQGAKAAIKAFQEALSDNVVSEHEVLRRTAICRECPKRQLDTGVRTGLSRMLGNLANKHRLPDEVRGKSCSVCGCSLMLLLPANEKDLHKDSPEEAKQRPDKCWIKQIPK